MAMGIPVICNAGVGDTDYIVNKYKSGYIINEFSTKEYKRIIDSIHKKEQKFIPTEIRKGAIDYFSLNNGVNNYSIIYKSVLEKI